MRLRLDISYDGTDFAGWAAQAGQRTVQGVLTEAVERITRTPVRFTVAGRTDSGVHATGQVAHLDLADEVWLQLETSLVRRLSGILPADIRVRAIEPVSADFDARFSALRRHYEYQVSDASWGVPPLRRQELVHWPRPLDHQAMAAAASQLLGEHDFVAFCRRREGATTVRCLEELRVARDGDVLRAFVAADAFCHSMVRSLMGALLAVGDGRREVDWPAGLLTRTARACEVTVAPPHGLTLVRVDYPALEELAARALQTRRMREPAR